MHGYTYEKKINVNIGALPIRPEIPGITGGKSNRPEIAGQKFCEIYFVKLSPLPEILDKGSSRH